jgi:hypothetical protein
MGSQSHWGSEDQTRHGAYEVAVEGTVRFQNRTSTVFESFVSPTVVGGDPKRSHGPWRCALSEASARVAAHNEELCWMTLIAAFRVKDTPLVLGDFMLSTRQVTPSGLTKKVHRIAPNLALAWTGHLIVAETVIGAARNHFENVTATVSALEHFLTEGDWEFGASLCAEIIGWIIDSETQRCFRWRSD